MGEQRHYRRPSQHKRRPPQTVMPCGSEDTPERQSEHRAETEKQPPRQPRKRLVQKPTPKSRQNPPEQWAKWRGQALDSAKQCAKRGAKRAERGLLQAQLAKYQNHYPYIVVDNEAGMEHISRGVLPSMQTAILVSDCSRRGVQAVGRIAKLIDECNMHPESVGLIVNRAPKGELNDGIKEEIEKQGLHLLGVVPQDDTVYEYDCEGRPTASLPEDNPVKVALKEIIKNLNL